MAVIASASGFSGITEPVLYELRQRWQIVAMIDAFGVPLARKWMYATACFSPGLQKWKHQYHARLGAHTRSLRAFRQRSRRCQKALESMDSDYDIVLQLSSMLLPFRRSPHKPYGVYVDRTIKMVEKHFPDLPRSITSSDLRELHGLTQLVFDGAAKVFTFNDVARRSVTDDYGIDQHKVFNVGSGTNVNAACVEEQPKADLVLAVCTDFKRHRGEVSINAFRLAKRQFPEATFVFVGDNPARLGEAEVEVRPHISHDELKSLYAKASVVVMPSPLGGLQTLTEAMANGCACIACAENPYVSELLVHGENGFVVAQDHPADIAALIVRLLEDRDLAGTVGARARERIVQNFTWARAVSEITMHLQEIL